MLANEVMCFLKEDIMSRKKIIINKKIDLPSFDLMFISAFPNSINLLKIDFLE